MKKPIFLPLLTILAAAAVLLGTSFVLNGAAAARAQAEHVRLMRTVLPGSHDFVLEPYTGDDVNVRRVHKGENGFVIQTVTNGYAAPIRMMVGVSSQGTVTGLVVEEMAETFGLGSRALNDHVFLAQLLNTSGQAQVGTDVDALSGATVTSKAIVRSVNSAVAVVTGADTNSGATSWGG